jgi:molybdopterin synthase catalytic subunit
VGDLAARVALTTGAIDLAALVASVASREAGAIATFLGTSRAVSHDRRRVDRPVETLWYECYAPMALRKLREIAAEAERRFEVTSVAVVHRTGEVPVGEASVAIAVAAPHRAASFDACRFVIDEIKKSVPIWKRERFADGEEWVEGYAGPPEGGAGAGGTAR